MAGVPTAAFNAKVRINSAVLFNSQWNVTPEIALLDSSNMESGGYEDQIGGLQKLEVHIEGWWDTAANMLDAPLNLGQGSIISFILYTAGIGSPNWSGTAIVQRVPMIANVHDILKYTLDFKAKGQFNIAG